MLHGPWIMLNPSRAYIISTCLVMIKIYPFFFHYDNYGVWHFKKARLFLMSESFLEWGGTEEKESVHATICPRQPFPGHGRWEGSRRNSEKCYLQPELGKGEAGLRAALSVSVFSLWVCLYSVLGHQRKDLLLFKTTFKSCYLLKWSVSDIFQTSWGKKRFLGAGETAQSVKRLWAWGHKFRPRAPV